MPSLTWGVCKRKQNKQDQTHRGRYSGGFQEGGRWRLDETDEQMRQIKPQTSSYDVNKSLSCNIRNTVNTLQRGVVTGVAAINS